MEKESAFLKEKGRLQKRLSKQLKKLQKKEEELSKNLMQCTQWEKVHHEGELMKFHFSSIKKGITSVVLHDWLTDQPYALSLNPAQPPQEQMAARFRQAKKMQKGIPHLTRYLKKIQQELSHITQQQQVLELIKTMDELIVFEKENFVEKTKAPALAKSDLSPVYKEYQSVTGMKIWVGKNAKANDQLTFQIANGHDWWFHVRGCSGSHVIIRLLKGQEPDVETLKDAMQLALYHSKARMQAEGEICFTQRKYLSKLKRGKPGLVQVSRHQTAWVRSDADRFQRLSSSLKR